MAYFSDRPCEIDKATALAYLKEGSALEIGELADKVRRKLHSNRAYYAVNAAITYSNICEVLCPICSFSKKEGQEGAYLLTPEEVFERAKKFSEMGAFLTKLKQSCVMVRPHFRKRPSGRWYDEPTSSETRR